MTSNDIRESGLLELYALGEITDVDLKIVESALEKDPSLLKDLKAIDKALFSYAKTKGEVPSASLKNDVLTNIRSNGSKVPSEGQTVKSSLESKPKLRRQRSGNRWILMSLLGLSLVLLTFQFNSANKYKANWEKSLASCDSITTAQENYIAQMNEIQDPLNQFLPFTATDAYAAVDLTLLSNPGKSRNFIKIDQLPAIASNQAFQLWSLKDGEDPIPLTVFTAENGAIIPLEFENGTATYAITIEKEGGALTPDLSKLIATVNV